MHDALQIVNSLKDGDIISILESKEKISTRLLTNEEKRKLHILRNADINRTRIEELFWETQKHKIFQGEITPLLDWAKVKEDSLNIDELNSLYLTFNTLFHEPLNYKELDITRRALLTQSLNEYPKIFNGNTNYSFCRTDSDWKKLINENIDKFRDFLGLLKDEEDIYKAQEDMCTNNDHTKKFDEFVQIPELLDFCKQKNSQWKGEK